MAAEIWKTSAIQITPLLEASCGSVEPQLGSLPLALFLAFKHVPIIVPKNERCLLDTYWLSAVNMNWGSQSDEDWDREKLESREEGISICERQHQRPRHRLAHTCVQSTVQQRGITWRSSSLRGEWAINLNRWQTALHNLLGACASLWSPSLTLSWTTDVTADWRASLHHHLDFNIILAHLLKPPFLYFFFW